MKDYKYYVDKIGEYGVVDEVIYPIIKLVGLHNVHQNELVIAETGETGLVFSIHPAHVEILLLSRTGVRVGTSFARTNEFVNVPVGEELLGWVITPLGDPLFGTGSYKKPTKTQYLEPELLGIDSRCRIQKPFHTGVSIVDMVIPLGKGQKELIVGDRKAGKTSFVLSTLKRQAQEGVTIVYAAIGKKKSEIKKLYDYSKEHGIDKQMVMVTTSSDDSPTMIYLTPLSAMSIAEYFRDQGKDVLVVLDDLSTHAKFYREVSLLADRFPGRESYPGDIFFVHARLIERAGNFKHDKAGEVSITCLPIVETVEGDLSGYIPTNNMGMTDGHIFFDSNMFYNGRRPGINTALSVTRVGKQTQTLLKREINRELTSFLSEFEKMQNYSHFGAELSPKVKKILSKGQAITDFFQQHYNETLPEEAQLVIFGLIWSGIVENAANIATLKQNLTNIYQTAQGKKLLEQISTTDTLYNFLTNISTHRDELLKGVQLVQSAPPQTEAAPPSQPQTNGQS